MLNSHRCHWLQNVAAALLLTLSVSAFAAPDADALMVGRYTTVESLEVNDLDPLAVVAQLKFPRAAVQNVGDALRYLLQRTGYSIRAFDDYSTRLFALPLPESQRKLGPARVSSLAQAITGGNYRLCIDRFAREIVVLADINGTVCPAVAPPTPVTTTASSPENSVTDNEVSQ